MTLAIKVKTSMSTEQQSTQTLGQYLLKHLAAYIALLFVGIMYFSPTFFDGMTLKQHDNIQSRAMQTEIRNYMNTTDETVRWTNQYFIGVPTATMRNPNINYIDEVAVRAIRLDQPYFEWIQLFFIMLGCYIGLTLMGVSFSIALPMAMVLGFFTAYTLYISAGHTGKIMVLSSVPVLLGSFVYAYRKNLLLGAAIFTFTLSYHLACNHVQITYYTYFILTIIGLGFLVEAIRQQEIVKVSKFAVTIILATLLGLLSNLGFLWPMYEYGKESTRGTSSLQKKENKDGLSKDYIFGLSLEKSEIGMLMFPNFYGGTQGKLFVNQEGSETQEAFRSPLVVQRIQALAKQQKQDPGQIMNQIAITYTRQYRGSQTMVGGPVYYGAVVCFLFILAMLLLQGSLKWGILSSLTFCIILAWGRHFPVLADLMYDYFPFYNKFRDTKMTLLVTQPLVMLAIGAGLMRLVKFNPEEYANTWSAKLLPKLKQDVSRTGYVILAGAIALGICVFTYLYLSMATLSAPKDVELAQISPQLVAALEIDRANLAKADIYKALVFIGLAVLALWLYTKDKINLVILGIALAVLACVDLQMVNREYLDADTAYEKRKETSMEAQQAKHMQKADRDIITKDRSIYRVADYSRSYPSQDATTCLFHKSVGGYSAIKPLLYQELWSEYQMDLGNIALQQHTNIMDMLNVKYVIVSPDRFMDNPTALGNAWFVSEIKQVANADEELAAIDDLEPAQQAVVQQTYSDYVKGLENSYTAGDRIFLKYYHPDTMVYVSETTKERLAIFSEMYYPPSKGWNVYIDGELSSEPYIKANYLLRGLKVPAGKHEIRFIFEPTSVLVGKTVGAVLSLLIIGFLLFAIFRWNQTRDITEV